MLFGVLIVILVGLFAFNYFRTQNPATNSQNPTIENSQLTEATASGSLPVTHIVQKGETLWSIAQTYYASGFNYVDIAKANNISNPGTIEIGQKLTIPDVASYNPMARPKITADSYTVVKGDSLWTIALRAYGDPYRWVEIAKLNNLSNPSIIHPGNILRLAR